MQKKGFTLLEIIIATTSFFLLLVIMINMYTKMIKLKYNIQAKTNIVQDSYVVMEKINLFLKDYTIDYEEYFNRKNIGCNSHQTEFVWDVGITGHCENFTAYGNQNTVPEISPKKHKINLCATTTTGRQSFGQYRRLGQGKGILEYNKYAEAIGVSGNILSGRTIGSIPVAIDNATGVQELYLISPDNTSRIFIRRAYNGSGDRNKDTQISGDSEYLYTLQILRLKGFDAGSNHDFDTTTSSGVYDGLIDTRACDYAQGFICQGSGIGDIYTGYKLPLDQNDGRTNIFEKNITISNRNLMIYPTLPPGYITDDNTTQINPYITINFTSKLYGKIRQQRLGIQNIDDFRISLQTSFNTKNFYTK